MDLSLLIFILSFFTPFELSKPIHNTESIDNILILLKTIEQF